MHELLEHCRAMMGHMSAAMGGSDAGWWMPGMMTMGGAAGIAPLIGLLLVALLVSIGFGLGWLLFRGGQRRAGAKVRDVLDNRYASGELDRDSYLRMRADLTDRAPTAR